MCVCRPDVAEVDGGGDISYVDVGSKEDTTLVSQETVYRQPQS